MDSTPYEAQKEVIEWAHYGESFTKLGFLKKFCETMGMEEIHHAKNILGKLLKDPENRKKQWIGPNPANSFKRKRVALNEETPSSLSRSLVPRRGEEQAQWWKKDGIKPSDVIGYDAEHVHLNDLTGLDRIRGGKVAVVGVNYQTIYKSDIYHRPGSFICHPISVRISGIDIGDLAHDEKMKKVTEDVGEIFLNKLIITVDGYTDFLCINIDVNKYKMFNLQTFYKRTHPNGYQTENMSLRDIYFLEFNQDFQGILTHSAEKDAKATRKCFLEGYVIRNKNTITATHENHFEIFDDAIKLKDKDKSKLFFCNNDRVFKDSKINMCNCTSCTELFYGK